MYVFLFIALVILGGAGYYEYDVLQDKLGNDEQKINKLTTQIDRLESDKKKLQDDNTKLNKNVNDDQNAIAELNAQVQTAQKDLNQVQAKPAAPATADVATPTATLAVTATAPSTSPGNKLGTITTRDGKSYELCKLLKFEVGGIVINHSAGITKLPYGELPDDLQKRFGYDPKAGPGLSPEQVQSQEQLRQATEGT